jgi:hypothetical protein
VSISRWERRPLLACMPYMSGRVVIGLFDGTDDPDAARGTLDQDGTGRAGCANGSCDSCLSYTVLNLDVAAGKPADWTSLYG